MTEMIRIKAPDNWGEIMMALQEAEIQSATFTFTPL